MTSRPSSHYQIAPIPPRHSGAVLATKLWLALWCGLFLLQGAMAFGIFGVIEPLGEVQTRQRDGALSEREAVRDIIRSLQDQGVLPVPAGDG